jgi:oligopeptide/dipeptide ABC transporter ATP-binding protein
VSGAPLLEVRRLHKTFPAALGRRPVVALRDVSFSLDRGETVALVGESGSGKSTIGRILLRLERADRGEVVLGGLPVPVTRRRRPDQAYRRRVQLVFQDPFASLNGANTVRYHLERPLLRHRRATRAGLDGAVGALLDAVGLGGAEHLLSRRPHELSGGQRQRVALARALAPGPELLVADEPTSMLDVSIRMGVLRLLATLRRERGLALLFITHDLVSAGFLADRVIVLYAGEVMEVGPAARVIATPAHPYTRLLVAAAPRPQARGERLALPVRQDAAPAPAAAGACPFAPRCVHATARCAVAPTLVALADDHHARCHHLPRP